MMMPVNAPLCVCASFAPFVPGEAPVFVDKGGGDDPETENEREMWFPKPAYFGVRNAFANYFGRAFVVRDSQGQEVARFAENGNVLLMKAGAHVVENVSNWTELGLPSPTGREFIVRDALGNYRAVITEGGVLYLSGVVMEDEETPLEPEPEGESGGTAFTVRCDGEVVSLIDDAGNLKLAGYLLEDGIPLSLPKDDPDDKYFRS